jgi:ketosteroid isomerase-like protein
VFLSGLHSHRLIKLVITLALLLAATGCSPASRPAAEPAGSAAEPAGSAAEPARSPAEEEAAVLRALADACDAYLKGDADRMLLLLTEDFTSTDPDGVVTTRADDIEMARKGTIRYEVFENRDMKVRLHGDAAVVTGRTIVKGQAGERAFAAEFQFTDTLVRTGGRWRVAATHISRVKA